MNKEELEKIGLFRYGVIVPLINLPSLNETSLRKHFLKLSNRTYTSPKNEDIKISPYTIERWYYKYKKNGFEGIIPKRRSDTGNSRKMNDDIINQIIFLKKEYPRIPATLIYQKLIDNGTINKKDVSLSTINRFVNKIKSKDKETNNKDMRRYEREHINEVWCGDSSVDPTLILDGKKVKTYIIALIDDASRMIVGIDVFLNDNFVNLMSVMKKAITVYGKPKIFNFDNGSPYKNHQMSLLAARIGTTINYCAPYTPTSKSKIERWFRTLKDCWMSCLNSNDIHSPEYLRSSLLAFVKNYNLKPHSSLNSISPIDRFMNESHLVIRLNNDLINYSFLLEIDRKVSSDCVVMINNKEYEVNYRYACKKIKLRYSADLSDIYVVDKETGQLEKIEILDKHINSMVKREKPRLVTGEQE